MSCQNTCRLCNRLVISNSVTFENNTLIINIPAGSYNDGQKYCIVVAQLIPDGATVSAPVVVTIGDGADTYPLLTSCCAPATAADVRTRTKYSTRLVTSPSGAVFRMMGNTSRSCPPYAPASVDGGAPAAAAEA